MCRIFFCFLSLAHLAQSRLEYHNIRDLIDEGYGGHAELIRAKLWLLWKPANDTGIDFVMTGRSDGYIAVGFTGENPIYFGSGKMIGAEAVVGWMNANGTPHVGAYLLEGKEVPLITPSPLNLTDVRVESKDGFLTVWFSRLLEDGKHSLQLGVQNEVIGALGEYNCISKHNHNSFSFVVDFETAGSYGPDYFDLQGVHLVLMGTSWGIILPFGMLWARFGRNEGPQGCWFQVHRAVQIGGGLIATAGFIVGLVMTGGHHFRTLYHGQLGVAIMICFFIQVIFGLFHPPKTSTWRSFWQTLHSWSGRILGIFALVNMYTGVYEVNYSLAATATVYAFYSGLLVIGIIGFSYAEWRHRSAIQFKRLRQVNDD